MAFVSRIFHECFWNQALLLYEAIFAPLGDVKRKQKKIYKPIEYMMDASNKLDSIKAFLYQAIKMINCNLQLIIYK